MKNPLTSLDELIWKEFEKVTQYEHKEWGWDKYDLARMSDNVAVLSLVEMGTYSALHGFIDSSTRAPLNLSIGFAAVAAAYFLSKHKQRKNDEFELEELKDFVETGAVRPPIILWFRPLYFLGFSGYFLQEGVEKLLNRESFVPQFFTFLSPGEYNTLIGLSALCVSMCALGEGSAGYFRSQIYTLPGPPTKKPFWKTMYAGLSDRFKPKAIPEPAAEPTSKYSLADHRIATNF